MNPFDPWYIDGPAGRVEYGPDVSEEEAKASYDQLYGDYEKVQNIHEDYNAWLEAAGTGPKEKIKELWNNPPKDKPSIVGMLKSAFEFMKQSPDLVETAFSGKEYYPPDSDKPMSQEEAVAELMTGLFAGTSLSKNPGGVGAFAGVRSANANLGLAAQAAKRWNKENFQSGKDTPLKIFQDTGWWKSRDGNMKYWIDDANFKLKTDNSYLSRLKTEKYAVVPGKVGDYVEHDELFKAYPDLKNTKIEFSRGEYSGSYDPKDDSIRVRSSTFEEAKSIVLHELQHAIQKREGFARGTSPESGRRAVLDGLSDDITTIENEISEALLENNVQLASKFRQLLASKQNQLKKMVSEHDDEYKVYRRYFGEAESRASQKGLEINPDTGKTYGQEVVERTRAPWTTLYGTSSNKQHGLFDVDTSGVGSPVIISKSKKPDYTESPDILEFVRKNPPLRDKLDSLIKLNSSPATKTNKAKKELILKQLDEEHGISGRDKIEHLTKTYETGLSDETMKAWLNSFE